MESEDAELLRLGENAIFRLRDSACVVRIGRNMSHWADATKEVAVSGWLAAHEYPAAKALGLPQPLEVDGHPVTFWEHIDGRNGARQDVGVLAELLRDLHSHCGATGSIARKLVERILPNWPFLKQIGLPISKHSRYPHSNQILYPWRHRCRHDDHLIMSMQTERFFAFKQLLSRQAVRLKN